MTNFVTGLPQPVPLRSTETEEKPKIVEPTAVVVKEDKKKERVTEVTMKIPERKLMGGKWQEDDDDEEEQLNTAMDSVLKAVDDSKPSSSKTKSPLDKATVNKILPGAQTFDDIEAYLTAAKKDKLEKLKQQNKEFTKSTPQRW